MMHLMIGILGKIPCLSDHSFGKGWHTLEKVCKALEKACKGFGKVLGLGQRPIHHAIKKGLCCAAALPLLSLVFLWFCSFFSCLVEFSIDFFLDFFLDFEACSLSYFSSILQ